LDCILCRCGTCSRSAACAAANATRPCDDEEEEAHEWSSPSASASSIPRAEDSDGHAPVPQLDDFSEEPHSSLPSIPLMRHLSSLSASAASFRASAEDAPGSCDGDTCPREARC